MIQESGPARWAQIDLAALRYNFRQIRSLLQPQVRLLAVVKGDAYGHGAVRVSQALEQLGADLLGVTTVTEGVLLRTQGVTMPILVFGPFLPGEVGEIVANNLTATLASSDAVAWLGQAARQQNKETLVHLKVETGMGRTGFWPAEIPAAVQALANYPELHLQGVYTHLATAAWNNTSYAERQFQIFRQALQALESLGCTGLIRHIANSAALLKFPHLQLDMVRTGTLLYGQYPSPELEKCISLQEPWSFQARVSYIRELPAGHSVGYGRVFTASRPTRVAIVPVGYSDGLQMEPVLKPVNLIELLKGIAKLVLLYLGHGKMDLPVYFSAGRGRIIGKVGMQLTMVDVTGIPGVQVGTVARIPIRRTAVDSGICRVYIDSAEAAAQDG